MTTVNLQCRAAHWLWKTSARGSARRFRDALRDCRNAQRRYLMGLLRKNRNTLYGRRHSFGKIASVEEFQRSVPLTGYEDYGPYIDRISAGEKNVLTDDGVLLFEPSSGSTSAQKLIPYTRSLRGEFQSAISPWMYSLYAEYPKVAGGRTYWSISPPRQMIPSDSRHGSIRVGFDTDAEYLGRLGRWVHERLAVVPVGVEKLREMRDFRNATLAALLAAPDLSLISVWSPSFLTLLLDWYLEHTEEVLDTVRRTYPTVDKHRLAHISSLNRNPSIFRRLWPGLAVISCWTDAASEPEAQRLRELFPDTMIQGKGLLATEACVSLPFARGHDPVLAVRSHFFEFIGDDGDCLAAHQVDVGREYSVVVTTGGGLYRYRLEDRVLVTGFLDTTPTLKFLGKGDQVCDLCGEKLNSQHVQHILDDILCGIGRRFCMLAPDRRDGRPCYTLYVDCEGQLPTDLPDRLNDGLSKNPHYRLCVDLGQLQPARIFLISGGGLLAYESRLVAEGMRPGDVKPACLSKIDGWSRCFEGEYLTEVTT